MFTFRARELDYALDHLEDALGTPMRLFLVGMSEGGMVISRYSHPKLLAFGLAGRILTDYSCEFTYFTSCAAHAQLSSPPVPVLNVLSAVDTYFGNGAVPSTALAADTREALYAYEPTWQPAILPEHQSTASNVSRHPNGYGAWPLTGQCARAIRAQGVEGVALTLDEPYHGGYAFAAAAINQLIATFVQNTTAMVAAGSVLTYDGVAVPNSMCVAAASEGGVLTASLCKGFESYLSPLPTSAYASTRCDWAAQRVRPMLVMPMPSACKRHW